MDNRSSSPSQNDNNNVNDNGLNTVENISLDELEQLNNSHIELHVKEQFFLSNEDNIARYKLQSQIETMHDSMNNIYHLEVNDDLIYEDIAKLIEKNASSFQNIDLDEKIEIKNEPLALQEPDVSGKTEIKVEPLSPISTRNLQTTSMFSRSPQSTQLIAPPNSPANEVVQTSTSSSPK